MKHIKRHSYNVLKAFYDALVNTINHDGIEHAGYIAFLSLLSFFPFMVFLFAIVGSLGQTEVGVAIAEFILEHDLIHPRILEGLKPRVEEIISGPPQGLLTIAIVGAIWTASSTFEGLRTVLNRAYRVETPPAYVWRRLVSIIEMFSLTAIVISVTVLLIITPSLWESAQNTDMNVFEKAKIFLGLGEENEQNKLTWLRYTTISLVLFIVVCTAYYILPNIKQRFLSVAPGAVCAVLLWFIAGVLFSHYLTDFQQVNIIYGSLGNIIACLLFFFFCAMIFIYGAEFNYLFEKKVLGHKIEQKENA